MIITLDRVFEDSVSPMCCLLLFSCTRPYKSLYSCAILHDILSGIRQRLASRSCIGEPCRIV